MRVATLVRDDPGCGLRIALFGPLQNNLYIALTHLLADLPVHGQAAVAIENTAQVVKRPAQIETKRYRYARAYEGDQDN
jgi:hypothetical protein